MAQRIVFLAAAAILSWLLASRVRLYALDKLLDIPNERSSHSRPTPRGGGLAIAGTALGGVIIAAMLGWIDWNLALALSGGGAISLPSVSSTTIAASLRSRGSPSNSCLQDGRCTGSAVFLP